VHLTLHDQRVDHRADVVDADVLADPGLAGLGVDVDRTQVRAVREGEVVRVERGLGVQVGLDSVRQVVRGERRQRDLADLDTLVGALDAEPAGAELQVVGTGLEHVRRDHAGLVDHLVGRLEHRHGPYRERPRPIGVHASGGHLGVTVQHLDVVEGHAQLVSDDLAPGGLVALTVRARSGDHLDVAGRQHSHSRVLPAAGAVGQ
jgi:hypothetical protein